MFGATGRVGTQFIDTALREGHSVNALVRSPEKLGEWAGHPFVTVIQGDATSQLDIQRALSSGGDVVVSTLGTGGGNVLSTAFPLLINAMGKFGMKRLVTVGTAGILNSRTKPGYLRYQSSESKRKLTRAAEEHHRVFDLLQQSNLDWTLVCPTYLPEGSAKGNYRIEKDFLPADGSEISTGDTALFLYEQIFSDAYIHARVGITY
nr:SDR family oxidoreductase [Paenibacillus sp. Marseille-Q4541]